MLSIVLLTHSMEGVEDFTILHNLLSFQYTQKQVSNENFSLPTAASVSVCHWSTLGSLISSE